MAEPCIGLLEFNSVAVGIEATDAMVKEAPVEVLAASPVCPGKYVTLITGHVDDVKSSIAAGKRGREDSLVDELVLPNVHPGVLPAVRGGVDAELIEAVGIIETFSVASLIVAADAAAKKAEVQLIELRLAVGLGGKAYLTLTGEVSNVRSSVTAGADTAREKGLLTREIVIPKPHTDLGKWLL